MIKVTVYRKRNELTGFESPAQTKSYPYGPLSACPDNSNPVTVYRKRNELTGFELSGHAESGPYGYDLVCAGVSAVSFGAINAVMELCNVDLSITQGRSGGYLR